MPCTQYTSSIELVGVLSFMFIKFDLSRSFDQSVQFNNAYANSSEAD